MQIIDRYLLRQFVQTFLICFISLTGLYIVIDAFTNLESFINCAETTGQSLGSLMGSYYAYRSLFFFDRTSGMLALIAGMFTITWIQRHNELTAIMAAGIPRIRVVKPIIAAAVAITIIAMANRELVIPGFREELSRSTFDLVGDNAQELQPRFDNQTDVLIRGDSTYAAEERISKPHFQLPGELDAYGNQLIAKEAIYKPAQGDRPSGYLLKDVEQPKDIDKLPSLTLPSTGQRVVITPHDEPGWLKPNECFLVSNVTFDQLSNSLAWKQYASTFQLIGSLRNPSLGYGADMSVAIHSRILHPFLDMTLLFLGMPLVLAKGNRNVFAAIGLCILVVSVFVLVTLALQSLGSNYLLSPALAAWAPLMLFVPAAVGMAGTMWE
ncbi:MAG: LptF/LptG family permease [Pirellulales bacterium]|nr:LptF/LptG family permease [Pirellulales bacterium]